MVKIVKLIICSFLLCSCALGHKIITKPIERPSLKLEAPKPLSLKGVKFVVITKDNAELIFKQLEENGEQPVLIALTGQNYKALAVNLEDIKNYIKTQKKIILLYKDYYEGE